MSYTTVGRGTSPWEATHQGKIIAVQRGDDGNIAAVSVADGDFVVEKGGVGNPTVWRVVNSFLPVNGIMDVNLVRVVDMQGTFKEVTNVATGRRAS